MPEADKSWGKGEGEVHSEFESYGFFYEIVDPVKVRRPIQITLTRISRLSLYRIVAYTHVLVRSW